MTILKKLKCLFKRHNFKTAYVEYNETSKLQVNVCMFCKKEKYVYKWFTN